MYGLGCCGSPTFPSLSDMDNVLLIDGPSIVVFDERKNVGSTLIAPSLPAAAVFSIVPVTVAFALWTGFRGLLYLRRRSGSPKRPLRLWKPKGAESSGSASPSLRSWSALDDCDGTAGVELVEFHLTATRPEDELSRRCVGIRDQAGVAFGRRAMWRGEGFGWRVDLFAVRLPTAEISKKVGQPSETV